MQLVQLWGFRFAAGDARAARAGEGDAESARGRRRVRWGLLAGLLRAINKCRCQHPPLDPRLSHVSSSPSLSPPLSISFSVSPPSPSSFPPSLPLSHTFARTRHEGSLHRSRGTTRVVDTTGEKKSRKSTSLPMYFPRGAVHNRATREPPWRRRLRNYGYEMAERRRLPRPFVSAFRKRCRRWGREPRDARLIFSLRGGKREPIFAPTREKLKDSLRERGAGSSFVRLFKHIVVI